MKPRPRRKGQSPRSKAHDDQVVNVEALRSVQSVNGATKGLRVEAFMCVVSRMLHHSYISSSLFFSLVQGNETYETGCNSHAQRKTTSGIRTIAVECHPGESHQMVRLVLPLFFFSCFFWEEKHEDKGKLQKRRALPEGRAEFCTLTRRREVQNGKAQSETGSLSCHNLQVGIRPTIKRWY